ncbi:hypothetical protein E2C01_025361 [Portunus trituberculatus]|uniref:Uncharacterized protein n=1 Tax=Portunus trituberculatus TaxID=210409 RepID=A0A5B7EEZ2_PORTR|nr:hypothetical protein [Portunus trituberculatus]
MYSGGYMTARQPEWPGQGGREPPRAGCGVRFSLKQPCGLPVEALAAVCQRDQPKCSTTTSQKRLSNDGATRVLHSSRTLRIPQVQFLNLPLNDDLRPRTLSSEVQSPVPEGSGKGLPESRTQTTQLNLKFQA